SMRPPWRRTVCSSAQAVLPGPCSQTTSSLPSERAQSRPRRWMPGRFRRKVAWRSSMAGCPPLAAGGGRVVPPAPVASWLELPRLPQRPDGVGVLAVAAVGVALAGAAVPLGGQQHVVALAPVHGGLLDAVRGAEVRRGGRHPVVGLRPVLGDADERRGVGGRR